MNKVILIGRLARDPEMRTTESGTTITYFTIAVNRPYNPQNSNEKAPVDFIGITSWRKTAENVAKYCTKGSQLAVEGHINTRNFDGQDGKKQYRTDIVADVVTFLRSSNKQSNKEQPQSTQSISEAPQEDPFMQFGNEFSDDELELPF